MQGDTRSEVETYNDYPFDVRPEELPDEPDWMGQDDEHTVKMTKEQLERKVAELVPETVQTVTASGRHTRTVAEADIHKATDEVHHITVSYDIYSDECHYIPGVGGWAVIVACLDNLGLLAE